MNGACRRALASIETRLRSRGLSSTTEGLGLRRDGPTETLKQLAAKIERRRRRKKIDEGVVVYVPESKKYLDTATLPLTLTFVGIAIGAKILWEYEYSEEKTQERIEQKIKDAPEGQGTVRMLTREEWDVAREVMPRTPFESKFARANARIRTGEPLTKEDVKDWTIDVITDALSRVEETVRGD